MVLTIATNLLNLENIFFCLLWSLRLIRAKNNICINGLQFLMSLQKRKKNTFHNHKSMTKCKKQKQKNNTPKNDKHPNSYNRISDKYKPLWTHVFWNCYQFKQKCGDSSYSVMTFEVKMLDWCYNRWNIPGVI